MSHANISIFVPHLGCPHQCSFCDQVSISGACCQPNETDIDEAVKRAVESPRYDRENTELAFFGGSFTAIDRDYMVRLLSVAYRHVKDGKISGIRISTRPDCIDREILNILNKFGVTAIELGAQSMCDDVLLANDRGHNADDVRKACNMILEFGFELGLQMMTGLYKSTFEKDVLTAEEIIKCNPHTVRIYPTITLKNTKLEVLYLSGDYQPPSLDSTVELCVKLLKMFEKNEINVIRTGLHSIDTDSYVAGPWHPAFKELCDSRVYLEKIIALLPEKGEYKIYVSPKEVSKVVGNKKVNLNTLSGLGYKCTVVADDGINLSDIRVERMNNSCF